MKIIIAGAGAVGTHLAKLLSDEKQDIILMDENEEKLSKLDSNFDLMTVNASPTSISGLKNAGVAGADLFIGVMPEESRNMTACMLATNMGAIRRARASSTMRSRLSRSSAGGRPRRPSLPPSARIRTSGLCCCSAAGRRVSPPAEVSPDTLVLMTRCRGASSRASRLTQPSPAFRP